MHKGDWIAGSTLGALYLVEAVISTGVFFVAWPVLGGVFAAGLARWREPSRAPASAGARAGARAGVIGGLVLLIVGTPLTAYLLRLLGEEPGMFDYRFDMGPVASLLLMFSIYALFGIAVAAAAGALAGKLSGNSAHPR